MDFRAGFTKFWKAKEAYFLVVLLLFCAGCLGILIGGSIEAAKIGDIERFERAGAGYVALAVFAFGIIRPMTRVVSEILRNKPFINEDLLKKVTKNPKAVKEALGDDISDVELERAMHKLNLLESLFRDRSSYARMLWFFEKGEIFLVFIGTLQWGYGKVFLTWIAGGEA